MKLQRLLFVLLVSLTFSTNVFARDLSAGMSGADVKTWQLFLIKRGYMEPPALGNFGARTVQATIAFQKRVGLQGLGVVGAKTIAKAKKLGFKPGATTGSSKQNSASNLEVSEYGPGLPLTEAFSDADGARALSTEPVFLPSRVGFSATAFVSMNERRLASPYVLLYVFTAGSPKWTGKNTLILSFGNRRLMLSGQKTTKPLSNTTRVHEQLRIRVPFSDFIAIAKSGSFSITIGDASFAVSKRNATGIRALAKRISR